MKKFINLLAIFTLTAFSSYSFNSVLLEDDVVISISQNDIIILTDVAKVMQYVNELSLMLMHLTSLIYN